MKNIRDVFGEDVVREMSLGDRMKWYEKEVGKTLDENLPAVIRIDGKAFHTYTKGFEKPFDQHVTGAMRYTMVKLCEEIQNVRISYMQSDEISLIMTTHENPDKQPWFGGKVDKIVSVAASLASAYFNSYMDKMYWNPRIMAAEIVGDAPKYKVAVFDARTWNVPMDEVNNVLVWRQQDAIRNSVSALAQSKFSHAQLHGKNVASMKDMLLDKGVDWNTLPVQLQRGFMCTREYYNKEGVERSKWVCQDSIPVFSNEKHHVNQFVEVQSA